MEVLEEDLPADLAASEAVCLAEVAADAPGNESGEAFVISVVVVFPIATHFQTLC